MSLENFTKLIELFKSSKSPQPHQQIKLLGGEPTSHLKFLDILNILKSHDLPYGLISNLLFQDPKILEAIKQSIQDGLMRSILANAAELDRENKLALFKNNYNQLLPIAKTNLAFGLSCWITLSRNKTLEQEVAELKFLLENLEFIELRLSLDFLGTLEEDKFFINNKSYGQKIQNILELCLKHQVPINFDCVIYPCIFETEYIYYKKIVQFIKNIKTCCPSIPFDVFPDMSYIHCYPASNLSGDNILQFESAREAFRDMDFRKKVINYNKNIPEDCQKCSYHQKNECAALCLGCSKLSSPLLKFSI